MWKKIPKPEKEPVPNVYQEQNFRIVRMFVPVFLASEVPSSSVPVAPLVSDSLKECDLLPPVDGSETPRAPFCCERSPDEVEEAPVATPSPSGPPLGKALRLFSRLL